MLIEMFAKGIKQADIAKESGIEYTTISKYINGARKPNMSNYIKIQNVYKAKLYT